MVGSMKASASLGIASRSQGQSSILSHSAAVKEEYRPGHVVPPLPNNLLLEFNSRDENGVFCAPEGHLKSKLLNSASSSRVIAA